ncbi:putative pentatricopeptide repeat-containing protein, mitochondrial isoform X2 [Iris pallida]|uniref:Pentatricopeptide repeat-containing protein, mitochondrial isoform X2 n=1 Tax=Iris pallida TaxID=29817 RepID=A0AAX6H328_IRIPA|nr:putative pentatricopeptide repeat-containing protein, mitochondrial isoform X2 [Iris pallida]KAJ6835165.1 putative pentatricopeptide repeat-containing protein, mitochondrial isoform X2 [Iris pallida]
MTMSMKLRSSVLWLRLSSSSLSPSQSAAIDIVTSGVGSLQDMESDLDRLGIPVTPQLVTETIDSYRSSSVGSSRRLLRFLSWSRRSAGGVGIDDEVLNRAVRRFSETRDVTAIGIALSVLQKEGRRLDPETFVSVVEAYVKSGRPEEAVSLFRNVEERKLLKWRDRGGEEWSSVTAVVQALCAKGHARKAEGVLWHHKDKAGKDAGCHRSLVLHGWSVFGNAREARRVIEEIKASGERPSLASYHDILRCVCRRNLRFNPSALVPEAVNLMAEMRSSGVPPTNVSFNILLSCLGRTRRVKEACRILLSMVRGEEGEAAAPDSVSYHIIVRLLYLTRRFDRGNKVLDQMIGQEEKGRLIPKVNARFYHDLIGILIGMENVDCALKLFERMKQRCCCENENYGLTYDLLIEKLCRNGKFDLGRDLWEEAAQRGITLRCSSDLLDPLKVTRVFDPMMKPSVVQQTPSKHIKSLLVQKKSATIFSRRKDKIRRKKVK